MQKTKLSNLAGIKGSPFRLFNSAGITAAIGLASLPTFLTLTPMIAPKGAFADEPTTANIDTGSAVALSISSALAITAENISISATPTVGNTFVTTKAKVNVKNTGSSGGYHLIMTSNDGGDITNTSDSSKKVSTFTEYAKTGAEMRNASTSSWGWTLQDVTGTNGNPSVNNGADLLLTYKHMPADSDSWNTADDGTSKYAYLKNTDDYSDRVNGDNITIGYAFAIGQKIPAGIYESTITYTAIPNKDNRTIFDMTNMQDLAAYTDACYNTPTPAVRTGNTPDTAVTESMNSMTGYSVGQVSVDKIPTVTLKDNRPMTGSTRTDLNDDKTKSYQIKKLADGHCWMTESLAIDGINAGTPLVLTSTSSNVTTDFELPMATASTGTSDSYDTAYAANDGVNGTYLYNWFAATAGTGTANMVSASAPSDICPKGWQLPNVMGDMSWYKLLREGQGIYEVSTLSSTYTAAKVNWGSYAGISTAATNPLGLQFTGGFWNKHLGWTDNGRYWTRAAFSNADRAYDLLFYNTGVHPYYDYGNKGIGRATRCVSR